MHEARVPHKQAAQKHTLAQTSPADLQVAESEGRSSDLPAVASAWLTSLVRPSPERVHIKNTQTV